MRDCLEVLRVGGGLDNGNRLRRGKMNDWKYIYVEVGEVDTSSQLPTAPNNAVYNSGLEQDQDPLTTISGVDWDNGMILPPPRQYLPYSARLSPCDNENLRVFHMFWTGPFTDKPYIALLSFLFTQNTGLNTNMHTNETTFCRPQMWVWISPGPAASPPSSNAVREMHDQLENNPWASPFLHPRFKDVIQFKLWNTTEQLDSIPELKSEWRTLSDKLFNSGGHVIKVPAEKLNSSSYSEEVVKPDDDTSPVNPSPTSIGQTNDDNILNRMGSKSQSSYDRLSVILSDMARFVLCHRFGGIYLDADTIFLRDWEELWGWGGSFAYRWSRLKKYNTAVLKLNKGSAVGTFLFRTALKNLLDFHPMTVSTYMQDAHLDNLLLRLPDALFDSAWLNTESYQRDRPPQPYFTESVMPRKTLCIH